MGRIAGHGDAKYLTGTRLASSTGRDWPGMLAEVWRHSEGDLAEVEPRETEIVVMLSGKSRVRRRGDGRLQDHIVGQGTIWLCPAGINEDMIRVYNEIEQCIHMYIPAAPLSESVLEELGLDPDRVRLHYDGGFRDPLIEQIGQTVYREVSTPGPADRLLIEHLTSALAVHVLRNHSNQNAAALRLPRAAGALTRQRLKRIDDFVEANLDRDLPLSALAREACLSPYHFARAFKASTGTPPHRYVIARRVERAKALIHDQSLPLADIAVACGFSSQAHFTTVFLKATGQTPGVYRNDRC